jgi:NTE family protein
VSRGLVLGGGGPLGIGWEAGLLAGLAEAGVMFRDADLVVGTSASSVVGAQLTSNRTLADVVPPMSEAWPWLSNDATAGPLDLAEMLAQGSRAAVSEEEFVASFGFLSGAQWAESFRCTSFGMDSGQFAIWDRASGVELQRAVASSCSVPGISPPVTLAGAPYIDGGARDMLNADLAIGHDIVVVLPAVRERIAELRSNGSAVEVVEPSGEVQDLSGWGRYLMDFARTPAAYEAGVRQGKAEAVRLRALLVRLIRGAHAGRAIGQTDNTVPEPATAYCPLRRSYARASRLPRSRQVGY